MGETFIKSSGDKENVEKFHEEISLLVEKVAKDKNVQIEKNEFKVFKKKVKEELGKELAKILLRPLR